MTVQFSIKLLKLYTKPSVIIKLNLDELYEIDKVSRYAVKQRKCREIKDTQRYFKAILQLLEQRQTKMDKSVLVYLQDPYKKAKLPGYMTKAS